MKYLLMLAVLLVASSVEAHGFGNQAFVVNRFGRQQVIVNNHGFNRQAVVVNRGFNRQAVVVGGHRQQQIIIQQRPRFSFGFGF